MMLIIKLMKNALGPDALVTHLIPKIFTFILVSFLTVTLQSNTLESDKIANAKTYVFVHGAGGGGWDWKLLDKLLTHRGHNVHRITLPALEKELIS